MRFLKLPPAALFGGILMLSGCERNIFKSADIAPAAMSAVPAVRLNFRYEADVPAPSSDVNKAATEERNAGVQADFDATRPQEILDRTLSSPDKRKVLAIYHRVTDVPSEFRLDMYSPDGKLFKKLTSDTMAVHFPDTIVWSPDSNSLAFVAMTTAVQTSTASTAATPPALANSPANANSDAGDSNSETSSPTPVLLPTPAAPTGILTFRTEQIYTCGADGSGVKAITQNEGLIYFYYAWSPDSSMLAALAATAIEWQGLTKYADEKAEIMTPWGRPRIVEKNGRERLLGDAITDVLPVWSPDSAKVAVAYGKQALSFAAAKVAVANEIRIYDANGTNPTQAAIPLRNQLLISSQAYDRDQQRKLEAVNANTDANAAANTQPEAEQPLSTLPDEKKLVSYNPIVEIAWTADDLLYLQTAYLKRMKNEADSVRSFSRWHRLALSAQVAVPVR